MSVLLVALVFGVGYPIVSLVVWCLGTFAIAASRADVERSVRARNDANQYPREEWRVRWDTNTIKWYQIWLTFACGLLWPIAVPVWLAWRKGRFIDESIERREALLGAVADA